MTPARKLTFQLASLLDLLLIVMFAQYLEVQTVAQKQTEQIAAERQTTTTDMEALQRQLTDLQQQLAQWEEQKRTTERAEHSQREQLGRLFGEMFRIPETMIQKIVKRGSPDEAGLSPAEIAALLKEFQSLATARGDRVVDHLLAFLEMKKRFDVWEIYLEENGTLVITAGSHQKRQQTGVIETPEQLSDELFKQYKSFPQTKSVVLMLVRFGDARLKHRLAVITGLPFAAERMRTDSNSTVQFEYAVLGYRPDAPLVE